MYNETAMNIAVFLFVDFAVATQRSEVLAMPVDFALLIE